jgi:uncharacterized ubiquitin-like protein YukD
MPFKAYRYALDEICTHVSHSHSIHRLGNFVWETSDTVIFTTHAMCKVHQHDTIQADNSSNSVDAKLHVTGLVHVQNARSIMSGKMKLADFRLVSHLQHVHTYPQHNTSSSTCIYKGDQHKSHMMDDIYTRNI